MQGTANGAARAESAVKLARQAIIVAALSGVMIAIIFAYIGESNSAFAPVVAPEHELSADDQELIRVVAIAAPALALDKPRTIALLTESCGDLAEPEQEIKRRFVRRFSTSDYEMTRAEAIITARRLGEGVLCRR